MTKVAIAVSTFNRPTYIVQAIESVLRQTFQDFHLYIMDNNSDDYIKDILKQYEKYPNVSLHFTNTKDEERIIHWDGILVNRAFHMGKEEYLIAMSDDNFLEQNALEIMVKKLDENPNIDIVWGAQYQIDPDGNPCNLYSSNLFSIGFGDERDTPMSTGEEKLDGNQVMFRRTLYEKIGDLWEGDMGWSPDQLFFKWINLRNILIYPVYTHVSWRIHQNKGQRQYLGKGEGIILEDKPIGEKIKIKKEKK